MLSRLVRAKGCEGEGDTSELLGSMGGAGYHIYIDIYIYIYIEIDR